MKKKLLVCIMALATVFAVTGCNKKDNNNGGETTTTQAEAQEVKLACEATVDTDTYKINITYKEDKVVKASFTSVEKYGSESEAKKAYASDAEEIKDVVKNKGVLGSSSQSGTLVTNNVNFTVADLDDKGREMYEEIFGTVKDKTLEDAKTQFTTNGYTCK